VAEVPSVSIALPAHNERDIIEKSLDRLLSLRESVDFPWDFEIIVVDDGSSDETAMLVQNFIRGGEKVRLISHPKNLGRGAAVRTAMAEFHGRVLVVLDSDLSYSPEIVGALAKPILEGLADLTLASPYSDGGEVINVPLHRASISRLGNFVLRDSFAARRPTSTSIVRGYSKKLTESLSLTATGKELNLEVLYKTELLGFTILDVPATLRWPESRVQKSRGSTFRGVFSLAPVAKSHLLFQFSSRPGMLFGGPFIVSALIFLYGSFTLAASFVGKVLVGAESALRVTFLEGAVTVYISSLALVAALILAVLFYVVAQGKQYFEEMFVLQSRIFYSLKSQSE
jgi:glycosyltransferase involved in cell wall biosynthesis